MTEKIMPTSIATGRESLAGKRQPDSGQGSESRAAVNARQGLTVTKGPAGGTTEVDRDA